VADVLVLNRATMEELLPLETVLPMIGRAFKAFAAGRTKAYPVVREEIAEHRGIFGIKSGYLMDEEVGRSWTATTSRPCGRRPGHWRPACWRPKKLAWPQCWAAVPRGPARLMRPEDIHATLGEILAGHSPGRTRADEITLFDATGLAFQDLVSGQLAVELAGERGVGTRVTIS